MMEKLEGPTFDVGLDSFYCIPCRIASDEDGKNLDLVRFRCCECSSVDEYCTV